MDWYLDSPCSDEHPEEKTMPSTSPAEVCTKADDKAVRPLGPYSCDGVIIRHRLPSFNQSHNMQQIQPSSTASNFHRTTSDDFLRLRQAVRPLGLYSCDGAIIRHRLPSFNQSHNMHQIQPSSTASNFHRTTSDLLQLRQISNPSNLKGIPLKSDDLAGDFPAGMNEESGQVDKEILQLKESVLERLKAYREKTKVLQSNAFHARERIKESFHGLSSTLLKEESDQLAQEESKEKAAILNLDDRVLELVQMSESIEKTLQNLDNVKQKKWIPVLPHAMKQIEDARKKLQTIPQLAETPGGCVPAVRLREWGGLRHIVKPVPDSLHFDRHSANPDLIVSPDLRQVRFCPPPFSVEGGKNCFTPGLFLLGTPGFQGGQHYWEVDVGEKTNWIIGVAKKSVQRKGLQDLSPKNGYWVLRKARDHVFYCLETSHLCPQMKTSPMRIGVFLDLSRGRLSFCDADNSFQIFNLYDFFVEETLFAFFCPGILVTVQDYCPLTLCN